jgi:hypothetical protein
MTGLSTTLGRAGRRRPGTTDDVRAGTTDDVRAGTTDDGAEPGRPWHETSRAFLIAEPGRLLLVARRGGGYEPGPRQMIRAASRDDWPDLSRAGTTDEPGLIVALHLSPTPHPRLSPPLTSRDDRTSTSRDDRTSTSRDDRTSTSRDDYTTSRDKQNFHNNTTAEPGPFDGRAGPLVGVAGNFGFGTG